MFDYSEIQDAEIYEKDGLWYSDNTFVDAVITIESNHKANAYNKYSGAKGLFQFVPSVAREYRLIDPFDAQSSLSAFKRLTFNNIRNMLRRGIKITPTNIYLAHQQGVGGLNQILNSIENETRLLPATLLRNVRNNNLGKFVSVKDYYEKWNKKIDQLMKN